MSKAEVWKVRAAELRRMANEAREAERERKMLALADAFEEAANATEQASTSPREEELATKSEDRRVVHD